VRQKFLPTRAVLVTTFQKIHQVIVQLVQRANTNPRLVCIIVTLALLASSPTKPRCLNVLIVGLAHMVWETFTPAKNIIVPIVLKENMAMV
jgi:hypothetical protein